jgi:hypothetical protein
VCRYCARGDHDTCNDRWPNVCRCACNTPEDEDDE